MKSFALIFISLFLSLTASAFPYKIPAGKMSDDQKAQIIASLRKFGLQDGTYTSKTASGEDCGLTADSAPNYAALELTALNYGRIFLMEIPAMDYRQNLLEFSETAETATTPATLHFVFVESHTERIDQLFDLTLTAKNGVIASFQLGSAGPRGGSNIRIGDVYDSADFNPSALCSGLVLK